MWGLAYRAMNFFFGGSSPLNKGEKEQPAPLEDQRAHMLKELHRIDLQIRKNRELQILRGENNPPDC